MHLQIAVLNVQRQAQALALNRVGKRRRDVEIDRVAELVGLGGAAGFNAGRRIARVVASEAGFAQRSQQIAQGAKAQKVEALVGDFEARLRLRVADLATRGRGSRGIVRLIDGDVVFLLHALDELLDQLLELLAAHVLNLLAHLLVEHVAVEQRLGDRLAQVVQRLLGVVQVVVIRCTAAGSRSATGNPTER